MESTHSTNTLTAILADLYNGRFEQTETSAALTFKNNVRVGVIHSPINGVREEWLAYAHQGIAKLAGARHLNRESAAEWAAQAVILFRRGFVEPTANWRRDKRHGPSSYASELFVGPIAAVVTTNDRGDAVYDAAIYVYDTLVLRDDFRYHPSCAESWAETMIAHIRGDRLPLTKEQVFAWVDDAVYACGQSVSNPRSRESIAKIIVDAWNGEMPDGLTLEPGESWRWINDTSVMKIIEDDNLRRLKLERK